MKQIILKRLTLRDFKGANFTLEAGEEGADVFGRNATGKTTLADAFSWLLFDKDSLGRSGFEIKNLDSHGEAAHGLEHSVEGLLDVNGAWISLKKTYKEVWSKKRGSAKATFTGNTVDYFIDGVPVQKKEYTARIGEIAGDEAIFRLLTSPTVFPALHWQKQRALLLEVCGDLTDMEVIESERALAGLADILGSRSIDDHRKVIAAKRAEINKELEKIPVRIDECRRGLPDITGLDRDQLAAEIQHLETAANDAKLKLQGVETGGRLAKLTKALAGVNADIQKLENAHYAGQMQTANELTQRVQEIHGELTAGQRQIDSMVREWRSKDSLLKQVEMDLADLRKKWHDADSREFQDTTAETCAACGQPLPSGKVQEAREKALAAFNVEKSEKLMDIEKRGKVLSEEKARYLDEMTALDKEREDLSAARPALEKESANLKEKIAVIRKAAEDYSIIPEHVALVTRRLDIESEIKAEKECRAQDTGKIREEIRAMEQDLVRSKDQANLFPRRESGEKRIEKLKTEEKKLAIEFERMEKELYLTEEFVRAKVRLLTDRINGRFAIARFKLFETQVNGGLAECCEITVNGIPYNGGLNNAARINAGLDVCRTLSEHYWLQAPIFVDNAESVCELIGMDAQLIRLVVSEKDPVLRVEQPMKTGGLI